MSYTSLISNNKSCIASYIRTITSKLILDWSQEAQECTQHQKWRVLWFQQPSFYLWWAIKLCLQGMNLLDLYWAEHVEIRLTDSPPKLCPSRVFCKSQIGIRNVKSQRNPVQTEVTICPWLQCWHRVRADYCYLLQTQFSILLPWWGHCHNTESGK